MRRVGDVPLELWSVLLAMVCLAALPIVLGTIFFKILRVFKPLEENPEASLTTLGYEEKDGFFKILLVGWLIFVPLVIVGYVFIFGDA